MTSRIQTLPPNYKPKEARRVGRTHKFSAEEQPLVDIIHKWYPELMNSSKYGDILSMGVGLLEENGQIKVPHEKCIVIYVKHKNEFTANIPAFLDEVPVSVVDTEGGIVAAPLHYTDDHPTET